MNISSNFLKTGRDYPDVPIRYAKSEICSDLHEQSNATEGCKVKFFRPIMPVV